MRKLIKYFIVKLRNRQNSISYNSDVSLNSIIGIRNTVSGTKLFNSKIGDSTILKQSGVFSSSVGSESNVIGAKVFSGEISDHVYIGQNTTISNSTIKRYTYLAGNNLIFNSNIGSFCSIAENVAIGHAEHPYNHISTSPVFYKKDNPFNVDKFLQDNIDEFQLTVIGNDVWIGLNTYIKSGVKVGNGSIIGAGAVVTKDVKPYSIVGGVPAKLIKMRFDNETISKLEKDSWWDLSDAELIKYIKENW